MDHANKFLRVFALMILLRILAIKPISYNYYVETGIIYWGGGGRVVSYYEYFAAMLNRPYDGLHNVDGQQVSNCSLGRTVII